MYTSIRDANGKTHKVEISVQYNTVTNESGGIEKDYARIAGAVDGIEIFLDHPQWKNGIGTRDFGRMESRIEDYLMGLDHPSHYDDKFQALRPVAERKYTEAGKSF